MKINKVKLYNFSSYEGNNEFDFEITDAEKNIVLIGGKNGAGKTSLFTAIKVALYGPLAYGYVGVNSHYISKIKDLINSKAFQQEIVESEVQITLQLKIERDIRNYVITRKWDYTNQRLTEEYTVERDGKQLNDQELSYFENYLRSIIPPDLFEFFLFDGEEVGNIFSTSAYNTYVRNAVFTMCGMDVFEIIRKFTRGYVTRNNSIDDDEAYDTYESAKQQMELLETEKENLESEVSNLTKELEDIEVQLTELTTAFKNAGGISRKEKKQLEDEFNQAEKVKTETLTNIKLFVEGLMPFYILRDFANPIMSQLDFEEKGEIFYYVQSKLNRDAISELLKGDVSDSKVDQLMDHLLDTFRPKGFRDDMEMMFDLSKEDIGRVNGIVSSLDDFDVSAMVDMVNKRKAASERKAEINRILKNSMSEEDINAFAQKENEILKKKDDLSSRLYDSQHRLEEIDNGSGLLEVDIEDDKDVYNQKNVFKTAYATIDAILSENDRFKEFKDKLQNSTLLVLIKDIDSTNSDAVEQIFLDINEKSKRLDNASIFKGYCFKIYDEAFQDELKCLWIRLKKAYISFKNFSGENYKFDEYIYMYLLVTEDENMTENLSPGGIHFLEDKNMDDVERILTKMVEYGERVSDFYKHIQNEAYIFEDICVDSNSYKTASKKLITNVKEYLLYSMETKSAQYQKVPLNWFIYSVKDKSNNMNILMKDFMTITANLYIYSFLFTLSPSKKSKKNIDHSLYNVLNEDVDIKQIINIVKELRKKQVENVQIPENCRSFDVLSNLYTIMDCFKVKENRFDVTYHNHGGQLYTLEHFIVPDNRNAKIKWLTKDEESIEISFTGQSERKKKLINYLIVEQKLNNDILLDFDVIKKIEVNLNHRL